MPNLLKRGRDEFALNAWDWSYLLKMAKAYGWMPLASDVEGAKAISERDARAMVTALEKALPEIPADCNVNDEGGLSTLPDSPLEWFSGDGRIVVRHFIAFCRGGAFQVL